MRSISSLCCYRSPATEQGPPSVERTGDVTGNQTQNRIDHCAGLGHIETERSHSSVRTEFIGAARGSGSDSGMGSGRDRLDDGNRSLARSRTYITRQERKYRYGGYSRHGAEDDDLNIISDPNALYLAPLISVSSNSTETRTTSASEKTTGDTMQRSGSISTAVPSPTKEQPNERLIDTEVAVSLRPQVRQISPKDDAVKKTTPSKLDAALVDDDSWSPFHTWLLTQTLDADTSPSRKKDIKTTPIAGANVTSNVHDRILTPLKGDTPDFRPLQTSTDLTRSEQQVFRERYPSKVPTAWSKHHAYAADRMGYSSGARYYHHNKGCSYSPDQKTSSDTNSPGRRNIHVSLSSRDEDERVYGVYRGSDRSSYKTATDMMSAPSRGMSDSSYYETQTGSGYESTFPKQPIPGSFPRILTSGSRDGPAASTLTNPLGALTGSRSGKKKPVRSKFREEFGDIVPDQPPRFRIVSKLRGLSRQGRLPARSKRSGEVVTNHIFLSDYDPEDVQARRNLPYHGCPQAAESAPEGWQRSMRRRDLSASGSYFGESQSVKELKTFANEPWVAYPIARLGHGATTESTSELVPSPLRTPHAIPRAGEDSLAISGPPSHGKAVDVPKHYSEGVGTASWAGWQSRARDSESSDHGRLRRDGVGNSTGQSESTTTNRDNKDALRPPRWPFSKKSGNARKLGSNSLSMKAASSDASEEHSRVRGKAQVTQTLWHGDCEASQRGYQELLDTVEGVEKLGKVVSSASAPAGSRIG